MVTITINGKSVEAAEGATVLQAARSVGVEIPALCYHPAVEPYAACRLCLVEVTADNRTRVVTSCNYTVRDGLAVETDTERIHRLRRGLLELYLAQAPGSDVIRELAAQYGIVQTRFQIRGDDDEKCILCGLCERVCRELMGKGGISFAFRGTERTVTTPFAEPLTDCLGCGACAFVCPTGAVVERRSRETVELDAWGAEVPMARCSVCGQAFAPAAGIEYAANKLGIDAEELCVCAGCRRLLHSRALGKSGGHRRCPGE